VKALSSNHSTTKKKKKVYSACCTPGEMVGKKFSTSKDPVDKLFLRRKIKKGSSGKVLKPWVQTPSTAKRKKRKKERKRRRKEKKEEKKERKEGRCPI
jgi:hypothetical protein